MDPTYQGRSPQNVYNNYSRRPGGRFRLTPRMLLIGGIVLVAIIIGFVLLANSGDKTVPLQQRLTARMAILDKMSADGKKNLVSGDLKEFNSRLSVQLISDQKSIGEVTGIKQVPKEITALEADTASFEELEDARLNSRFDSTYRTIVGSKLDSTTALMKELYDKTRSKKLKDVLGSSYRSLKQLEGQLAPVTNQ